MKTPIYFIDGEIIAESGHAKVYEFNGRLFLEIGPGHNLWADSEEVVEYADQLGRRPYGDCLEIGLGLGCASNYVLDLPHVKTLTTVELNTDVINVYGQIVDHVPNNHTIVNQSGVDYLLNTSNTFDFIFLDFYDRIDEDVLPDIELYVKLSKKILNPGGEIVGWWDIYTPSEFTTKFIKIFED